MGIVNRDLEVSQQMNIFTSSYSVLGTSGVINLGQIPYSAQLMAVVTSAFSLSGSPITGVQVQRFIIGKGVTTFAVNGSSLLTVTAYSTSGIQLQSLPAVGNSLVQLLSGDNVQLVTSGANTAASYNVSMVVQCLQDFQSQYGLGLGS